MKRFLADERGQHLVMTALMMTFILAILALVVDLGMVYVEHRKAQNAADAAAVSAAAVLCDDANLTQAHTRASQVALAYASSNGYAASTPTFPGGTASYDRYIQVTIPNQIQASLGRIMLAAADAHYEAGAVARAGCRTNVPPVTILDPSASGSLELTGGIAMRVHNGGIQVNSTSSSAALHSWIGLEQVTSDMPSTISGDCAMSFLFWTIHDCSWFDPEPVTGAPRQPDPLAGLGAPSADMGSCPNHQTTQFNVGPGQPRDITPGVYDKGIYITGGTARFRYGTGPCAGKPIVIKASRSGGTTTGGLHLTGGWAYFNYDEASEQRIIIDSGDFEVSILDGMRGNNVLFYLGNGQGSSHPAPSLDIRGVAFTYLTPPPAGSPYAGVQIFQAHGNANDATIYGLADTHTGVIYLPDARLEIVGAGHMQSTLVVDRFYAAGLYVIDLESYPYVTWRRVNAALTP
jgi:hypothetical protein